MMSLYYFLKNYTEELTGGFTTVGVFTMITPYHVLIDWTALFSMAINGISSILTGVATAWVVHRFKKRLEKSDKRKTHKREK